MESVFKCSISEIMVKREKSKQGVKKRMEEVKKGTGIGEPKKKTPKQKKCWKEMIKRSRQSRSEDKTEE